MIKLFCDSCNTEIKDTSHSASQFTYHEIRLDMSNTSSAPTYDNMSMQLCEDCTKIVREVIVNIKKKS